MKKISLFFFIIFFASTLRAGEKNPFADFEMSSVEATSVGIFPMHPTGSVGLYHTFAALKQPASLKSFGIGFSGNYYQLTEFPLTTLITERFEGGFFLNYTPHKYLELFGAINVVTTNNEAPINPLVRQIPNFDFGAKFAMPLNNEISVGFVYHGESKSSVSNVTGSQGALNHNLLALGTYDMTRKIPVRLHLNAGYRVDNNNLVSQAGADARIINIVRAYPDNALLFALGAEYLFPWASFSLEYSLDSISGGSFSTNPQRVTIGARFFPTSDKAFAINLGSDIATSNADASVAGTYKEPTYSFYFGINYLFGMNKKEKETFSTPGDVFGNSNKPVSKSALKKEGKIMGYVSDIETGNPVSGARITYCAKEVAPSVSDQNGRFHSADLPEGPCAVSIEHPEYQPLNDQVNIASGIDNPFDFGLLKRTGVQAQVQSEAAPAVTGSKLILAAKNQNGEPVQAEIYFANDSNREPLSLKEDGKGTFEIEAGPYELYARNKNIESQTNYVLLKDGEEKYIEFKLAEKSNKVKISKDNKSIEITEKIQFEVAKDILTFNSKKLVEEIIEVLKKNPEIKLLEIAGHTDSVGDSTYNLKLSQARADAVRDQMLEAGVAQERLRSLGYGEDFPIATNENEEGQYQNRRVEFRILKRQE